jgi:WD40 repeat protein
MCLEFKEGQKGIISCIAVNPMNPSILAVGSYDKSIGLYEEPSITNTCVLIGQKGGLTHLKFSSDGNRLYSGGRKVCLKKLSFILLYI